MNVCCIINGETRALTWYDLLEMLTTIRKLEMHGLIDGNKFANDLLDYYAKNYKELKP
jgi:hypothetical protein